MSDDKNYLLPCPICGGKILHGANGYGGVTCFCHVRITNGITTADKATEPQEQVQGDYETNIANREANHIHDSDAYFDARPQINTEARRKVFEDGYQRGWESYKAMLSAIPQPSQDKELKQ